jgi:hypothetical protein
MSNTKSTPEPTEHAADYEAPSLSVIGNVTELTMGGQVSAPPK